jgi:hypothetical protein
MARSFAVNISSPSEFHARGGGVLAVLDDGICPNRFDNASNKKYDEAKAMMLAAPTAK